MCVPLLLWRAKSSVGVDDATGEDEEAHESCLVVAATDGARGKGDREGRTMRRESPSWTSSVTIHPNVWPTLIDLLMARCLWNIRTATVIVAFNKFPGCGGWPRKHTWPTWRTTVLTPERWWWAGFLVVRLPQCRLCNIDSRVVRLNVGYGGPFAKLFRTHSRFKTYLTTSNLHLSLNSTEGNVFVKSFKVTVKFTLDRKVLAKVYTLRYIVLSFAQLNIIRSVCLQNNQTIVLANSWNYEL